MEAKISDILETLIMFVKEDDDQKLLTTNYIGDIRHLCEECSYNVTATATPSICDTCPLSLSKTQIKKLEEHIKVIKTMELIDE